MIETKKMPAMIADFTRYAMRYAVTTPPKMTPIHNYRCISICLTFSCTNIDASRTVGAVIL